MLLGMRMMNFQNDITISLFPVFHEKIKMRPLLLVASTLPLLSTHHNWTTPIKKSRENLFSNKKSNTPSTQVIYERKRFIALGSTKHDNVALSCLRFGWSLFYFERNLFSCFLMKSFASRCDIATFLSIRHFLFGLVENNFSPNFH